MPQKLIRPPTLSLLIATALLAVFSRGTLPKQQEEYVRLDEERMLGLVGTSGGCDNCHYDPRRQDECSHYDLDDDCKSDECIANYLMEDTCDVALQTSCTGTWDPGKIYLVQYVRQDTNCTTDNPDEWQTWVTHYYDDNGSCGSVVMQTRCEKPSNNCNGTLIEFGFRTGAIDCE